MRHGVQAASPVPGRTWLACAAIIVGAVCGFAPEAIAGRIYTASFESSLDSGFGGLPPTLLAVTYVFEKKPPVFAVPHEAYYEFQSIEVRLNGVSYAADPLEIGVQNDVPYSSGVSRDSYSVVGTVSGTYAGTFALSAAGLAFVKFGDPPQALTNLSLPTSVADLGGFTVDSQLDHRFAFLAFENLATGGLFTSFAPLTSFSMEPVKAPEPGTLALLGLGLAGIGLVRLRKR